MSWTLKLIAISAFAAGIFMTVQIGPAHAQMENNPWGFKQQNRASIAALMQQVENKETGAGTGTVASGSLTNLVCGSGGQSSASGNTTCVILNNSNGTVDIDQDSQGNQTATNSETTSTGTTTVQTQSNADDVLSALEGAD